MKRLFIILLSLIILLSACKKSDNPVEPTPPSDTGGNIKTGPAVDIITQPISTGGGTIKITKPGDPLDGFELTVPPNSFTQTQTIKVSYSPITSHQLGSNFNPISPLIHIEYNGGIANKPMKLKIPVKVTNGKFAMPFIYDKSTGKLIPMLIQEIGTDYVLLSTKYFSSNGQLNKTGSINSLTYADVAISDIDETKLSEQGIIDSGYKSGFDDWEFINWGSYIAPGGHCAGQAITSMWYYIEKKKKGGALSLFHLLDKVNDPNKPDFLWQDNPKGFRLASTIQQDFNFSDWLSEIGDQSKHPDVTFKAFAYSMLITKEPQLVFIAKVSPDTSGHAMVVYKVDYANKKLFIADPNYPNNRAVDGSISERVINYTGNKLGPYTSGATAANVGIVFDRIGYYPKTAYIKWEQISARWVEVEAGIIGQDRFPNYTLYVGKVGGDVLTDNYKTSQNRFRILSRSTDCPSYLAGTDRLQFIYAYDDQGNTVGHFGSLITFDGDDYGKYAVDLKPGNNKFGFYIMGGKGNKLDYFVDFKWINIIYNEIQLKIIPDPLNGQTNTEYTFSVNLTGTPPSNAKYVWNFGDGTSDVTVQNSTTVKHTFANEGVFEVKCSLYDNSNNTELVSTHSTANILSAFLMDVLASKSASIFLQADFKSSSTNIGVGNQIQLGNSEARIRINNYIKWNGLSFTTNYVYKIAPYTGTDSVIYTGSVSGTISSDGKMISTFSAFERQELKSGTGSWIEQRIDAKDLPYYRTTSVSNQYRNTGASVASNIALVSIRKWTQNPNTQQYELVTLSSVNYNSTSTIPDTYISLTK